MHIGLTGGIACGKSTVADMLVRRGAILIDADRLAREVVEAGSPVLDAVAARFGQDVLLPDGSLNRKRLGEIVFQDKAARKDLEAILHPEIRKRMFGRMASLQAEQPDKLVAVDVPLMFESGLEGHFDEIMVVYVPRDVQVQRLMERDGLSLEQAELRLAAQMPIEQKKSLADIVIDNRGSVEDTERQVDDFWRGKGLS
ncbi:dephospho-CoA kinase [Paenibacillus sp. MBLB4367]|uniref:dephospho-CoA kinase n=1 Tax=Paenibacillus sp. MBLB4367 TaxID=3384767 RepID=UPI003907FD05